MKNPEVVIRLTFYVVLVLFSTACTNKSNDEALIMAKEWCDCISEFNNNISLAADQISDTCINRMMDSSKYMVFYLKNGGKIDKELTIEEIEDGLNTFDRFQILADSICGSEMRN
jgi:archaellum component FlaG (FlaF/FlaG flagellin family)